jgi:short-subunit dehydrogenase
MVAQRMEQQYKIKTAVIPADLGASAAVVQVVAEVTKRGIDIDLLVNNAGFGIFERFLEAPLKRQMEQVDVNIRALVTLTYAFAPGMVARRKGGIINLASSAGFQPLAGANIYAASKSFVILFSEALAQELDKQRVHVLAVCPGPVATAFFADKKPTIGRNQMDDPKSIVREVLRAFDAGKGIVIPGKFSIRLNAFAVRLLPRTLIARIAEGTTRKLNHQ